MNILEYLLEKYPNESWDWNRISDNPNLTIGLFKKFQKNLSWRDLFDKQYITMDMIEKYYEL